MPSPCCGCVLQWQIAAALIWVWGVHWYLHVACHAMACTDPRLSQGLWRTGTPLSASLLLYLEALASHLPSVAAMLPVFSCAQVRYGNTKADPDVIQTAVQRAVSMCAMIVRPSWL